MHDSMCMLEKPVMDPERQFFWADPGWGILFDVMWEAGVLSKDPTPSLPDGMENGDVGDIWNYLVDMKEHGASNYATPSEKAMGHWREYIARVSARSPVHGKVSDYKFTDGGMVTPEECDLIADALEAYLENTEEEHLEAIAKEFNWGDGGEVYDWIEEWKDYNRLAASHGGYFL